MISYEFEYAVGKYVEIIDWNKTGMFHDGKNRKSILIGRVTQVQKNICGNTSYMVTMSDLGLMQKIGEFSGLQLRKHEEQPAKDNDVESTKADMAKEAVEQIESGEREGDFVDADEVRDDINKKRAERGGSGAEPIPGAF